MPTKKTNIEEIIKRFQKGDKEAFSEIIKKFHKYVFLTSLKFLRSIEDAEDLTQEIFLKLYTALDNFEFRSDLKTYIYKMITNAALHYYEKDEKLKERYEIILNESKSHQKFIEDELLEKEKIAILEKAIKSLPEKYKRIIFLKDFKNLSYKQISKKLKISENTAKLRHFYALKLLKTKIESKDIK